MNAQDLSIAELAGQRIMVGFNGLICDADLEFLIRDLKVGGLILFSCNIDSKDQISELCQSAQDTARSAGHPPLLIAIDQEGGEVARLKAPFTEFPGNPRMKAESDAEHFGRVAAGELSNLGINMNMAPVMDLAPENVESIMAGRAFGSDPQWVSRLGTVVIQTLQENGVMAVAKHFPGIGRTTLDSHLDLPVLETNETDLEDYDLIPFCAAIEAGVAGFMLSHIRYTGLDDEWPASLSETIARNLLRRKMGYGGVVMTDDLDMGAIRNHFTIQTCTERILAADIDIALICHRSPDMETIYELIYNSLKRSEDLRRRGELAVNRILELKKRYLS